MSRHQPYRPPLPQIPADPLRGNPCDSHDPQRCVPPLKGPHETRAAFVSYRALAPGGAGFCCRICTGTSESRLTAHYSLLTANSSYTFSAKERDAETGLSYFGSRYYSSDLSVWLSVDPMAAKYPSLSPYVYCADNPVKLVDPDGETWETPEDESTANKLITHAEKQIESNHNLIKQSAKKLQRGEISQKAHDDFINDINEQNALLEEGIKGIRKMGTDGQVFHFNVVNGSTRHNVRKVFSGDKHVIKINVNEHINIQWHECVHIIDYFNDPKNHDFDKKGYLGSTNSVSAETHAYRSEWSFYKDETRFPGIKKLYDINESFIEKRKSYDK